MDAKLLTLIITACVLLANVALAVAGVPSTLSCTFGHAVAGAQEIVANITK